ncbi:MAG: mannose-1-phosphate guanylyltransferase [Planctomycetaceae bacterium]|nr:mannose-1-phosphate guanylyltransferase [Planctomycetaceae bacterium]
MLHAVVMSGGSGTRFWPRSRKSRPKQLLALAGKKSMIRETVDRVRPWIAEEQTWVVTNKRQSSATAEELPEIPKTQILVEPQGRNTAPCIGLAAVALLEKDPEAMMLVMPADHVIGPKEKFEAAVLMAVETIEQDPEKFVLFGVPPNYPSTGFGYIERGEPIDGAPEGVYEVASFREKPVQKVAEEYLAKGSFYWNCGIFVWRADKILAALKRFEPEMHERLQKIKPSFETPQWHNQLQIEFPLMRSVSIDVGVLEKAATDEAGRNVAVIEAPFEWDDLGSWQSLPRRFEQDEEGNTVQGHYCGLETKNCIISSQDDHLIATIGVEDLIIVHTPDATLVARKDDENAIRQLIEKLGENDYGKYL